MSNQTPQSETLRVGYSTGSKLVVAFAACFCWLLTYSTFAAGSTPIIVVLPLAFALFVSGLLFVTFRSGYTANGLILRRTTWRGHTTYLRPDFLGSEAVADKRGKPGILLRFKTGVLLLSETQGCSDPKAIQTFLETVWNLSATDYRREPAGPVQINLVLEYENTHLVVLGFATILLSLVASLGPMFWATAILAFFTGRTFHRIYSCQRITTDHEGITISRPFQPKLKIGWHKIASVSYWYSLVHGGMLISDGTNSIRVYRWVQNYPRFNRLLQDQVAAASFPAPEELPWSISLNRRNQSSWLVLLVIAGISLWLVTQGAWPAALILFAVPVLTLAFTMLASGRKMEIDKEEIRVTEKKFFSETTRSYRKTDLEDMRLGRQLSAGGLWLRFKHERLEIGNLDSACAPEEILAVLRREWQWDAVNAKTSSDFRAA